MYRMNSSMGATGSTATTTATTTGSQQAAFEAELARVAAAAGIINSWADKAKASGKFDFHVADRLKEVPASVAAAFLSLGGDKDLALKVNSTAGDAVIGTSSPDGPFKFVVSKVVADGGAVLWSERWLGDAQSLELMVLTSNGAAQLAKAAGPSGTFGILAASPKLREQALVELEKMDAAKAKAASKEMYLGFKFASPAVQNINRAGQVVVGTAAIYHGYKRNESIGWALAWGILGTAFWPIAAPLMLAQGFGKPLKK